MYLDVLNANWAQFQISWPSVIQKTFVSSSICQFGLGKAEKHFSENFICLLDNVSRCIECKLGPISNCMAISHSEELRQACQLC